MSGTGAGPAQSDYDKLRRIPFLYVHSVLTATAVLCTVQAPLALYGAELGLGEDRIGLLGGIMPFFQVLGVAALPLITGLGCRKVAGTALLARYGFLILFLFAPLAAGNTDAVFLILLCGMIGFSLMRALAEAAFVPWSQEFMPRGMRGRITGRMALAYVPVALVVSWFIQLWLDSQSGIGRFYPVFGAGIAFGAVGALSLFGLRGGAAREARTGGLASVRALAEPLRDRNFLLYLYSSGTQYLVFIAINLFMLIFFRQRLGMSSGQLVLMAAFVPVGAAIGSVAAGWFVDRYGTRAIRVALGVGQVLLMLALPLVRPGLLAEEVLVASAFLFFGVLFQGGIAVQNVYMLNTIPESSKESYTTLHYGVDGIIGGGVTFAAGVLLTWLEFNPIELGAYSPGKFDVLFFLAALVSLSSALVFAIQREEGAISVRDFVGHFVTGSPMRALWGIHRYSSPNSEERRRQLAYVFGSAGSPLAKEELIQALRDPSFDVRHEAIQSLGQIGPHRDVVAALEDVLRYDGLVELQYAALAALGRLGAGASAPTVLRFVGSGNPLLRSRAVRTLGDLRHGAALPAIRHMLAQDGDLDCRLAAVSALGKLADRESVPGLLAVYRAQALDAHNPVAEPRSKVVLLALAKILRCEEAFARNWRREEKTAGHVMPELFMRLGAVLREGPGQDGARRRLRAFAASPEVAEPRAVRDELATLRPRVAASGHPDALSVLALIDSLAEFDDPHPAALVLLATAMPGVFGRPATAR